MGSIEMTKKDILLGDTAEGIGVPAPNGAGMETLFTGLPDRQKLAVAYKHLEDLRSLNGGYIASPYKGQNGGDRYDVFWLRDIMYATYANEYVGSYDKMIESYSLILRIFQKYRHKISSGARKRHYLGSCAAEVIHARVHPITLEEITHQWGHHQLDIFGLFLYKTGDLIKKGHNVPGTDKAESLLLFRDIVLYLTTVGWHSNPDFGMWEEGPEAHSSSVGSVLAGLTMWHDDGYYHHKYSQNIDLYDYVPVPQEFLEIGRASLDRMLPSESASRPHDMAQLSLIWPYNIVTEAQAAAIVKNIEHNLVRKNGLARYPGDRYYNSSPETPFGNEAEWPLGFAWLSIAYSKLAMRALNTGDMFPAPKEMVEKARHYLEQCEAVMTPDGKVPELYSGGKMNWNTPLAWAQSLYIVAHQSLSHVESIVTKKKPVV
ncbi:MAG: glycoside hydrolase family 15 protein [Thermodesulfobacteriota bacterium]